MVDSSGFKVVLIYMMTVTLSSKSVPIQVASYREAAEKVQAYIRSKGMGSAAWYRGKGGQIHENGIQTSFVSYNGRVWRGIEDFKPGHEEIVF